MVDSKMVEKSAAFKDRIFRITGNPFCLGFRDYKLLVDLVT